MPQELGNSLIMAVIILWGLCVGSFINVCICRIPKGESVVFGASHCPRCGERIRAADLIPVLSFVLLTGRCRHCGEKISPRYPVVELVNAAAWALFASVYGITSETILYCLFFSALLVAAFIDYDTKRVPQSAVIVILLVGVAALFLSNQPPFYHRLIGFFAASLPLFIIAMISKGGIGGGDIKLMAACGLVMGWRLILLSLFLAVLLGGAAAAALLITGKRKRGDTLALAPYLAVGMFVCLLFGEGIIGWYLSLY